MFRIIAPIYQEYGSGPHHVLMSRPLDYHAHRGHCNERRSHHAAQRMHNRMLSLHAAMEKVETALETNEQKMKLLSCQRDSLMRRQAKLKEMQLKCKEWQNKRIQEKNRRISEWQKHQKLVREQQTAFVEEVLRQVFGNSESKKHSSISDCNNKEELTNTETPPTVDKDDVTVKAGVKNEEHQNDREIVEKKNIRIPKAAFHCLVRGSDGKTYRIKFPCNNKEELTNTETPPTFDKDDMTVKAGVKNEEHPNSDRESVEERDRRIPKAAFHCLVRGSNGKTYRIKFPSASNFKRVVDPTEDESSSEVKSISQNLQAVSSPLTVSGIFQKLFEDFMKAVMNDSNDGKDEVASLKPSQQANDLLVDDADFICKAKDQDTDKQMDMIVYPVEMSKNASNLEEGPKLFDSLSPVEEPACEVKQTNSSMQVIEELKAGNAEETFVNPVDEIEELKADNTENSEKHEDEPKTNDLARHGEDSADTMEIKSSTFTLENDLVLVEDVTQEEWEDISSADGSDSKSSAMTPNQSEGESWMEPVTTSKVDTFDSFEIV